jgi:dolichol-phosphate mannosyltransferase
VEGSQATRNPVRRLISDVAMIYTRLLLGRHIRDWSGGYKCYRREALRSLNFDDFRSKGYSIGMETLYRLTRKGFSFVEIPIEFTDQRKGESKFSAKEILGYMINVLRLRLAV